MKESKIGPVAGYISITLGIVGLISYRLYFTCFSIGATLGTIGMIFGYISYGYTNRKITYAGIILCNIAILWVFIICIIADENKPFLRYFFI